MIKFEVAEGITLPETSENKVELVAHSISKCYRGSREIAVASKIFENNNALTMYPFERVIFFTGLTLKDNDSNLSLKLEIDHNLAIENGLVLLNIDNPDCNMVCVTLYNPTQYPVAIKKNQKIAKMSIVENIRVNTELIVEK